jgi:hypothetical protein
MADAERQLAEAEGRRIPRLQLKRLSAPGTVTGYNA